MTLNKIDNSKPLNVEEVFSLLALPAESNLEYLSIKLLEGLLQNNKIFRAYSIMQQSKLQNQ